MNRPARKLKIQARKPKDNHFGDFTLTNIDLEHDVAIATHASGMSCKVNIHKLKAQLKDYSRKTKTLYARVVY